MRRQVLNMSVGDVAANVWSSAVDWDQQQRGSQRDAMVDTNQSPYRSHHHMNHINHSMANGRSRVSRSLFGPSDREENRRMAYEETDCRRFSDRNRWNFDFYSEKPFTGRFEWTRVHQSNDNSKSGRNSGQTGEQTDSLWSNQTKKSAKS